MIAGRERDLKGSFESRKMVEPQAAAAIVDKAVTAEPPTVSALDRLQLHLGFITWAGSALLALHAYPWAAQRRQIAVLQLLVRESGTAGGRRVRRCRVRREIGNRRLLLVLLRRQRFQGRAGLALLSFAGLPARSEEH